MPSRELLLVYVPATSGGSGKFANATAYLDYFGMADFTQNTLVLRHRGQVCYAFVSGAGEIVPGFFCTLQF